ncbi:MAG: hypothetical protein A2X22_07085 [Bacteroidetes bacterium GWF2_49_14]|nr:MAG: hypothetical protein A2X22_07085 [Bacteroidetes bacterium GWF2_49_14]
MKFHRIILTGLMLAFCFSPSDAARLRNVPQQCVQPDGTILNCLASGDEHYNWLHDARNFTIMQDPETGFYVYAEKKGGVLVPTRMVAGISDPSLAGLQPGLNLDPEEIRRVGQDRFRTPELKGTSGYNTTGTLNNIVIFIRFSDQNEYTTNSSVYNSDFNATGSVSMIQYFHEVSKSQLTINTQMFPGAGGGTVVSYQDSHPRNYFRTYNVTTNPIGYQNDTESMNREMTLLKAATEAVKAEVEAAAVDYDNDNDGYVDNICFIVQGGTEGWSDLLWPHMWALYPSQYEVRISGLRVYAYNFQLSQSFGVSVLCHEMSHTLGFPDLYRYTDTDFDPVGPWDIMANNTSPPQHQSVYTKEKYGRWFTGIPQITTNGTYTLDPLSTDAFAGYRISSPNSTSEYFVLEYRKSTGMFESGLVGSGLVIYRVNSSIEGNSNGPPDEVYVYRTNGTPTNNGSVGAGTFSLESGKTTFSAASNPSCFLSDGSAGGIEITNIGSAGPTISFTVNFGTTPPALNISPDFQNLGFPGGETAFNVTNTGGSAMAWTTEVTTGAAWLHIISGSSGTNSGTILLTADANPDNAIRTGVITVTAAGATGSPKTVNVVQAANSPVLVVSPASQDADFSGGSSSFAVSNSGGGTMAWTASVTTGATWLHVTSGSSGSNSGTILLTADANPDNAIRTGVITVTAAGATGSPKTATVVQAANSPVLMVSPDNQNVDFPGSTTSFTVSNTGGGAMGWTATVTVGAAWLHITSGSSGSNSGTIQATADANPDNAIRTGVITVTAAGASGSPRTVNVVQAANLPVLMVNPGNQNIDAEGGIAVLTVSNSGGGTMSWTAAVTTGASWIRITAGSNGSNSGTILLTADANPDNGIRTAVITVTATGAMGSPRTATVVQAANSPVLVVSPASQDADFSGGSSSFAVSNSGGGTMAWTASVTTGATWLHITSGSSGSNSGTILLTADANPDNAIRTGVITVTAMGATGSPKTVNVVQAANSPVLFVSPDQQSIGLAGGTAQYSVMNTGGGSLNWTASVTTGAAWLRITSGSSGSNSGTITVSADPNQDNAIRTGVVTVTAIGATGSPQTVTLVQANNPPVLVVTPDNRTVVFTGGPAAFEVSNTGGGSMVWTAEVTTGHSWLRITSGSSGINAGTVNVTAEANPDHVPRTGEITVTAGGAPGSSRRVSILQEARPVERPDLVIRSITAIIPAVTWPENIRISITVGNIGVGASTQTEIHFYLSETPTLEMPLTDLGHSDCDPISSGMEVSKEVQIPFSEALVPGTYYLVALVDAPGLNSEPDESNNTGSCRISVLNGIPSDSAHGSFSVYPVPASDYLTISWKNAGADAEWLVITNLTGQRVLSEKIGGTGSFLRGIDVSGWIKGFYTVTLFTGDKSFHKLVIIN